MSDIFGILCFSTSRKVNRQLKQAKKKICAECVESAVTDQTCQKWFAKFCAADFWKDIATWPCRPVEIDSDEIETLIENHQYYTMWEIADIFKISKSIKLLVKMKNVSFIL